MTGDLIGEGTHISGPSPRYELPWSVFRRKRQTERERHSIRANFNALRQILQASLTTIRKSASLSSGDNRCAFCCPHPFVGRIILITALPIVAILLLAALFSRFSVRRRASSGPCR